MLDQLYEVADDIKSFLLTTEGVKIGPVTLNADAGQPTVAFRFSQGRVEIHKVDDIHIIDESDKRFNGFFETRRYLAARYL